MGDFGQRVTGEGRLALIPGGAGGQEPPATACVVTRGAVRAGDRNDPWVIPAGAALRALAEAAQAHGVDLELAVRVTAECALVCDDLAAAGVSELELLDVAAAEAGVDGPVDSATAAYLRRLSCRAGGVGRSGRPGETGGQGGHGDSSGASLPGRTVPLGGAVSPRSLPLGDAVTVGLPVRLAARLLRADLDVLLAAAPLERALAWEVAAVLSGRTMSEWAPLTALAGVRARTSR